MTPAPVHHPSTETLAAYAAGTLRAGFDFVIAAHVRGCAQCRGEVARLEGVGGALLAEADAAAMSEEALMQALARIETAAPPAAPARTIEQIIAAAKKRWVAPGVWTARIDTPHAKDDRVYLLGVAPGVQTAKHTHSGAEFTVVLQGALNDGGVVYRAGDFCERDPDDTHHPKVEGAETCVCLFATQGRLVPSGVIGRIAFALADV
ncbi:MAG: cupin domain-containing protein [Hyphomonadaceae bacterium]|nr:cupin domain-containing protein [Hyphomonadaceae bacterium]